MIRATLAEANYFVLQKNYLAKEKAADLSALVETLAGLPGEPHLTPFLSMWARLTDFTPDLLLTELYQTRHFIKYPLVRNVDYIVPVEQFATWYAATARQRNQALNAEFRLWGLESNEAIERLAETVFDALGDQPATLDEISERLPAGSVQELTQTSRGGRVSRTTNVALALRWLVGHGRVATTGNSTDWRDETPSYARLSQLHPDLDLSSTPGEAEAQKFVVKAYLSAFGPATEADISFWAGFGKSETARAVNALSNETMLTMVEGIPGMLLTLKNQADSLKSSQPPATAVISVLPADDPYATAHRASRSRFFADQSLQRRVFSSSGAAKATILANGQVVGVWKMQPEQESMQLQWQLLATVDSRATTSIEAELAQIVAFIDPQAIVVQIEK